MPTHAPNRIASVRQSSTTHTPLFGNGQAKMVNNSLVRHSVLTCFTIYRNPHCTRMTRLGHSARTQFTTPPIRTYHVSLHRHLRLFMHVASKCVHPCLTDLCDTIFLEGERRLSPPRVTDPWIPARLRPRPPWYALSPHVTPPPPWCPPPPCPNCAASAASASSASRCASSSSASRAMRSACTCKQAPRQARACNQDCSLRRRLPILQALPGAAHRSAPAQLPICPAVTRPRPT